MRQSRWLGILILLSVPLACGGTSQVGSPAASAGPPRTFRLSTAVTVDGPTTIAYTAFAKAVEKATGGRLKVQVFPNSQLGSTASVVKAVQAGSIDFQAVGSSNVSGIVPSTGILEAPFLFPDYATAYKALDGAGGKAIAAAFSGTGVDLVAIGGSGYKAMTNSKRPINTAADLSGLKMRSISSPLQVAMWKNLGAQPTTLDITEVYTGLATHTVDGWDSAADYLYANKYYEVQKYVTITHHVYAAELFIVSDQTWKSLSSADQAVINKAAADAVKTERRLTEALDKSSIDKLQAAGMQVTRTPDTTSFRNAVQPVYQQAQAQFGATLMNLFLKP